MRACSWLAASLALGSRVHAATCPAWVDAYAALHSRTRETHAPYFLVRSGVGGGFGDELRFVLFMYRVAAANDFLLFLDLSGPEDGKLAPSSIDWRLPSHRHAPSRVLQPSHDRVAGWFERDAEQCLSFLAGALSSRSSAALACSLEADHEDARLGTSLALVAADDAALHCMFASLFTSSKALQRRIDTSLQSLFGSEQRVEAFAAAHLRLGGLAGEGHDVKYGSITLLSLSAAHGCLTRLAGQHSPRIDALVVVTDNTVLRHAIASGMLSGVSGPGGSATHSASASASDESAWQAWTELGMLAQAQCLVTSASGFSNIARWWGGQVCVKTLDACIIELLDDNPDIDDLRAQAAYYKRNGHWPPSELDLRIEQLENQSWSSKQAARP